MTASQRKYDEFQPTIPFKLSPGSRRFNTNQSKILTEDQQVTFDAGEVVARHNKQHPHLAAKKLIGGYQGFSIPPGSRYAVYKVIQPDAAAPHVQSNPALPASASDSLFQEQIYLFNVVVALEWQATNREMRQLKVAFQNASDFLYDVTDGYMAFGQVIFGGLELMPYADIQIMASNRFNPRSWVDALNIEAKYMPIRVGRGIWHKHHRVSIPWDEPEGYRTLIHEWARYALGLRDEYLETVTVAALNGGFVLQRSDQGTSPAAHILVIPTISLATESIMGTLEGTSELVPRTNGPRARRKQDTWQIMYQRYPGIGATPPRLAGPHRLPVALPSFPALIDEHAALELYEAAGSNTAPTASTASPDLPAQIGDVLLPLPPEIIAQHCWIYVVKGPLDGPTQVIAQGTLDARAVDDGFRLLNATAGDALVVIAKGLDGEPIVLQGKIDSFAPMPESDDLLAVVGTWAAATPAPFPIVDVVPTSIQANPPIAEIRIQISSPQLPDQVWLFPLGQSFGDNPLARDPDHDQVWLSMECKVSTLDGHVLMRWNDGKLLICTFSQGGGPATHVAALQSPITAGSSEGNVMIFFKDEENSNKHQSIRVVTTLIPGMLDQLPESRSEARSYAFSIASNTTLPADLTPTLIMYFDTGAVRCGGDLLIHRQAEGGTWISMPTYQPEGRSFAAMPLLSETAPSLFARRANQRIERYRLYWTPR